MKYDPLTEIPRAKRDDAYNSWATIGHTFAFLDFGTNIEAPPPRNPAKELIQSADAYAKVAPSLYALDLEYQPKYSRIGMQNLAEQTRGYNGIPGTLQLASEQRTNDIRDVLRLGPTATAAVLNANPWLAGSLGNLYGRLADSGVLQLLNQEALQALQSGGQLSPQEQTDLEQQTRAGFARRGQLYGNQALGAEIMNRDAMVRARRAAAESFAAGVEGLNRSQSDLALRAPTVFSSTLSDPFMAILGRPSQTNANQIPPSMFNVTSPYFSDLYNTNYNADAAARISSANNTAALWGAGIKAVGSLGGAAIGASDRRLKKDVRDTGLKTHGDIPLKTWRYRKGAVAAGVPPASVGKKMVGPMASEVQKRFPHLVRTMALPKSVMLGNRPVKNVKMVAHPALMPKPT